ncbi:N-acetylmuramoyl-L-alanine amidase [Niallia sp. Krafla_26]|uniref:N-acetylmuramoyl-L-alanine amidase n=1 Tax=Niallia sp. Krafla_26 TaxID=3064703 RepID=UPI003D17D0BF
MQRKLLLLVSVLLMSFVLVLPANHSYAQERIEEVEEFGSNNEQNKLDNPIEEISTQEAQETISNESLNSSKELSEGELLEDEFEEEMKDNESTSEVDSEINSVKTMELNPLVKQANPIIKYSTHVQGIGWQNEVSNGKLSGTQGEKKRLESIQIAIDNGKELGIGVKYSTNIEGIGWTGYVYDGSKSGTVGKAKRLEAIKIELTGKNASNYDIYYRVHAQTFGWLSWAKNGEPSGTEGLEKRLEAIEIIIVEKSEDAPGSTEKPFFTKPSVVYTTHVQTYGWLDKVKNGKMSGTISQGKRLEAIKIDIQNANFDGNISYTTHVQSSGWLDYVSNDKSSGTVGKGKRLEAIKIKLNGEMAKYFDVYYRVHAQTFGWLDWTKNGEPAGTEGLAKRLEAIEIVLVNKGGKAPGATEKPFLTHPSVSYTTHIQSFGWGKTVSDGTASGTVGLAKRLEAIKINLKDSPFDGDIVYSTHVQSYGWLKNVTNGGLSGKTGESKRLEAIQIKLTGEIAKYYDIYYRVHAQTFGWLGWAKNGMKAGSEGHAKRLEAIEINLVPKGEGKPVNTRSAFKRPLTVFLDPGHGGTDSGAVGGGYKEASLNLVVANKTASLLRAKGYTVYMSRTGNTTVGLYERPQMANDLDANIFVSLHHNSSVTAGPYGIESYYYKYKKEYPSKINESMHNDPERVSKSKTLTNLIHDKMVEYTGAKNRGTDGSSFAVIRESEMPATLLELGYINNASERKKLVTSSYQNKLAKAIADGIAEYFEMYY